MGGSDNGLQRLHEVYSQLQAVQEKLARGPVLINVKKQAAARKLSEIETHKETLKTFRLNADRKSLQMKTNEAKLADLQSKLHQCSSNREYEIFQQQIEADKMANSVLEDEILEILEKVDRVQTAMKLAHQEHAAILVEERELTARLAAAESGLKVEAEQLQTLVSEAEKILPDVVMPTYRRLVLAHGASALSPVKDKACGTCYISITSNRMIEMNMQKIVFCSSCGRMLYRPNELSEAK